MFQFKAESESIETSTLKIHSYDDSYRILSNKTIVEEGHDFKIPFYWANIKRNPETFDEQPTVYFFRNEDDSIYNYFPYIFNTVNKV